MDAHKLQATSAYTYWSAEDDTRLLSLRHRSRFELALLFGRTRGAITSRLKHLDERAAVRSGVTGGSGRGPAQAPFVKAEAAEGGPVACDRSLAQMGARRPDDPATGATGVTATDNLENEYFYTLVQCGACGRDASTCSCWSD